MSDFEVHDIGRVAQLKARIFELEQGSCRFNCRTKKEAFLAGFDAGTEDTAEAGRIIDDDFYKEVTEGAYKEWCEQKD